MNIKSLPNILAFLLFCNYPSEAQNKIFSEKKPFFEQKVELGLPPTAKTTASSERLIGYSKYNTNTGVLVIGDSINYNWSGGRGSLQTGFFMPSVSAVVYDLAQNWRAGSGSSMELYTRQMQTFNSNGDTTEIVVQIWNKSSSTWQNTDRRSTTYSGKLKSTYTEQNWDITTSSWRNALKEISSYKLDTLTSRTNQQWDNMAGIWKDSEVWEFDFTGSSSSVTYKKWNAAISNWENINRSIGNYTGSTINDFTFQNWDKTKSAWVNNMYFEYTYAPEGLIEHITKIWDNTSTSWINSSRLLNTVLQENLQNERNLTGTNRLRRGSLT
jgi:hypothetical protein